MHQAVDVSGTNVGLISKVKLLQVEIYVWTHLQYSARYYYYYFLNLQTKHEKYINENIMNA